MTGHIYRDVILEQHVRLLRGAMGAEFLFMDDNARPHRANIAHECLQSEDITRKDLPAYSPDLNPIDSSSCASASSSNARELDEQILEVKINPQEKNTVSDTSTNKYTLSKEKESENENEEAKLIRNDFAHYIGTPIDADLREEILKLGSYQREGNFQKDSKGRSFSSSYYSFLSKAGQKIERKWLCYSTQLHVAYCQGHMKSIAYASPVDFDEALFARIAVVAVGIQKMRGVLANVRQSLRREF
ncbi:transposable element Tc3 transposase [Trichonephila clavipes]|nr:transposable element Tc3 transposase [Trichonephila clavipes]